VSSDHECMPLVPGPPGVWHAADVANKTQHCRGTQCHLLQVSELGIESSPLWLGQIASRCTYKSMHL